MKIKASEDLVVKFCTVDGEMTVSFESREDLLYKAERWDF